MAVNPILTGERRNQYTSSGSLGPYNFTFVIYADTDLAVYVDGTLKTLSTHYTVSTNANGTGSITFTSGNAPASSTKVTIIGNKDLSRTTRFTTGGPLTADALETEFNNQTLFLQQIDEKISRALTLPIETSSTRPFAIPNQATRASKVLTFDSSGNAETTVSSAGLATLSGIATEIQTVAGIASDVTTVAGMSSNISTVAGLNSQIAALGPIAADITTLATFNSSDITTVANNIAKVQTAADDLNEATSEIDTVANSITNVDAVGGAITNINTVAGAISPTNNIQTVAQNITGVNSFAERYRVLSAAPSTSNDVGDLYFDTSQNELKVYKSSGWAAAGSTVNGTSARFIYNITGTPTTLTGASGTGYSEASGNNLSYDAGFLDIFVNGVKQVLGVDVTATSGNSVVFASALANGDVVDIVAYGTFQLANISINDLTDTPAALGSAGQALVVNSGGTALEYSNASSAEVYGFKTTFTASTIHITVTDSGGAYYINGVQQDTLNLLEGNTYIFTHPSAHPFRFSTNANNSPSAPYTTGVTVDSSTQVTFVVPASAPQLYYYCSSHSGMGGTANTTAPAPNTLQVVTTNQGADNITQTEYESFDDVQYAASGFTWSISSGKLIATI